MPRALIHPEERLLSAAQCAERAGGMNAVDWWAVARDNLILRRARVQWRGKTYWLASGVARWLQALAGATKENPRAAVLRAGREAKRAKREEVSR